MPNVHPNPDRGTWSRIESLLGLRVPDPAVKSARNPRARTKKQDPALNPAWKLASRARPRAPAWNSGIEWHMCFRIPIEIRDAALNPCWDTGSRTGSQLLPCRPHGVPDHVRRSMVPHSIPALAARSSTRRRRNIRQMFSDDITLLMFTSVNSGYSHGCEDLAGIRHTKIASLSCSQN